MVATPVMAVWNIGTYVFLYPKGNTNGCFDFGESEIRAYYRNYGKIYHHSDPQNGYRCNR